MIIKQIHPFYGMCYVLAEALYHNGGKEAGLKPYRAYHEGVSHWWLQDSDGKVIDLSADQFYEPFPYHMGRRTGFLTAKPSKRTVRLMSVLDEIRRK